MNKTSSCVEKGIVAIMLARKHTYGICAALLESSNLRNKLIMNLKRAARV